MTSAAAVLMISAAAAAEIVAVLEGTSVPVAEELVKMT
jgi:hypothetical protein